VGNFAGGRLTPLSVERWFHLHNPRDLAFTEPIRLDAANFEQVRTEFAEGLFSHGAEAYLGHAATQIRVWRSLATRERPRFAAFAAKMAEPAPAAEPAAGAPAAAPLAAAPRTHRALLVGINAYPNPADRLAGCVNDALLVSSVLQECGFDARDIRLLVDERATQAAILDRLAWLWDDVRPGDQRVFYYSGHGAQLPRYDAQEEVDHLDECLVPADFAWPEENAICDDDFVRLYSQLPYRALVTVILDCCHSGGMSRGGGPRTKALDPPDDVRHRLLRWDARRQMWVRRALRPQNPDAEARPAWTADFVGTEGTTRRLGRAVALRTLPTDRYDDVRARRQHSGPYLPVLLEACQENELAFEYVHGSISYGAFTYSLCKNLRRQARTKKGATFEQLLASTRRELRTIGYRQTPSLLGPRERLSERIPWRG
jgi:hypothetical protein